VRRVISKCHTTYWASRLFTTNEASLCNWKVYEQTYKMMQWESFLQYGKMDDSSVYIILSHIYPYINKHRTHKHDRRRRRAQWWVELHYWVSLLLNIWSLDDNLLDYILCWIISCVGFYLVLDDGIWKLWELDSEYLRCSMKGRRSGDTTTSWHNIPNHAQQLHWFPPLCILWHLLNEFSCLNLFGLWQ